MSRTHSTSLLITQPIQRRRPTIHPEALLSFANPDRNDLLNHVALNRCAELLDQ